MTEQWGATYAAILSSVFIFVGAVIASSVSETFEILGMVLSLIVQRGRRTPQVSLMNAGSQRWSCRIALRWQDPYGFRFYR